MKKIILLILILLTATSLFALPRVNYRTMSGLAYYLSEFDVNELSQTEKLLIYEEMKQSAVIPTIMNLGIGFGKGSKLVGDVTGENIGLIADSVAWGLLTAGFGVMCFDLITVATFSREYPEVMGFFYSASLYGGLSVLAISHIVQAIMPSLHVSKYNKTLKQSLGLTDAEIKLGFVPTNNLGITAIATIRY